MTVKVKFLSASANEDTFWPFYALRFYDLMNLNDHKFWEGHSGGWCPPSYIRSMVIGSASCGRSSASKYYALPKIRKFIHIKTIIIDVICTCTTFGSIIYIINNLYYLMVKKSSCNVNGRNILRPKISVRLHKRYIK